MAEQRKINGSLALNTASRVITIPAAEQEGPQRLRVAAYCRVSSDSADQLNSFAAQNAYYTALITRKTASAKRSSRTPGSSPRS